MTSVPFAASVEPLGCPNNGIIGFCWIENGSGIEAIISRVRRLHSMRFGVVLLGAEGWFQLRSRPIELAGGAVIS
jgi:hypothetical protein